MRRSKITQITAALTLSVLLSVNAFAAVSFVSATGGATLSSTVDDNGDTVFVFDGVAEDETSVLSFSTDSTCPGVAMTGGAEFVANWSCADGVISATVTDRGGMSFGPGPEGKPSTFYVVFSDPPAAPGSDIVPTALSGIQISVFGDVSSWDLDGNVNSSGGVEFGVKLSGTQGGAAHFRMDLPAPAVTFLGGVLGVSVGGKADPFATVTTNDDGSVGLKVDIASLSSSSSAAQIGAQANIVTKKITAGARTLSVGFEKSSVKVGKSVLLAMCSGATFTSGAKVPVKFTVGGKDAGIKKTLPLDSKGCAKTSVQMPSKAKGTLTAKVTYKGTAKSTIKVTK